MRGEELDFEAAKANVEADNAGQANRAQSALAAFVTMPLVFLIVVMASLAVFGKPGGAEKEQSSTALVAVEDELVQPPLHAGTASVTPASYTQNPTALGLPTGAAISAMSLDGDRLAVEANGEIILYDLRDGSVLQRIKIHKVISASDSMVNAISAQDDVIVSLPRHDFELTAPSLNPKR